VLYLRAVDRMEPLEVCVKRASLVVVFCILLLPTLALADTITFGPNGTGSLTTSASGITTGTSPGVIAITTPLHPYSGASIGTVTITAGAIDLSQSGGFGNTVGDAFDGISVTVTVTGPGAGTLTETFSGDQVLTIVKSGSVYNFTLNTYGGTGTATSGFASYYLGAGLVNLTDIDFQIQGTVTVNGGTNPHEFGTLHMTSGSETFESTPESATLSLVGIGLVGLLGFRRRSEA